MKKNIIKSLVLSLILFLIGCNNSKASLNNEKGLIKIDSLKVNAKEVGVDGDRADTVVLLQTKHNTVYIDLKKSSTKAQLLTSLKNENKYISLNKHQDNYYLYAPCDWMYHHEITIKEDSVFMLFGEPDAYKIIQKNIDKRNITTYKLQNEFLSDVSLSVKVLDQEKGISVLNFRRASNNHYFLMVNSSKINQYPIIINDCPDTKVEEFEFDEIDAEKLFRQQ